MPAEKCFRAARFLPWHFPSRHQPLYKLSEWRMTMREALAIAAVMVGLGCATFPAHAQGYTINGRGASQAEAQLLASHGAQPGKWLVDGYGILTAEAGDKIQRSTTSNKGSKCWYVLDVLLCD
jgi:hypothetical protein